MIKISNLGGTHSNELIIDDLGNFKDTLHVNRPSVYFYQIGNHILLFTLKTATI